MGNSTTSRKAILKVYLQQKTSLIFTKFTENHTKLIHNLEQENIVPILSFIIQTGPPAGMFQATVAFLLSDYMLYSA